MSMSCWQNKHTYIRTYVHAYMHTYIHTYNYIPVQIVDAYLSYVLLFQETEWLTAVHGLDGKCRPPQRQSISSDDALCRTRSSHRVLLDYIRDAKHHWSSFEDLQGTTLTRFLHWPRCQTTMHHNDWWLRRREKFHQNGLFRHSGTTLHVPRPAGNVEMALGCQVWNSAWWSTRSVPPVQAVDVRW